MSTLSYIKEGDWLIPKQIDTPQGPEHGPIIYRIFASKQSINKNVTVDSFVTELAKVMLDIEVRLSIVLPINRGIHRKQN